METYLLKKFYIIFFMLLFLTINCFGYETITILSKDIQLKQSGWSLTNRLIEPKELIQSKFHLFNPEAKSYGMNSGYYNYYFSLDINNISSPLYLKMLTPFSTTCQFSLFNTKEEIFYQQKEIKKTIFELNHKQKEIKVLLQCHSNYPDLMIFALGERNQIEQILRKNKYIFVFVMGIFISLFFYNFFIYITTKDKAYLFYLFYISSIFIMNFTIHNYFHMLGIETEIDKHLLVNISVVLFAVSLGAFTNQYLNLAENQPKLQKKLFYMLTTLLIIHIIEYLIDIVLFSPFMMISSLIFILYIAIKSYASGYKPAIFYLIATGVYLASFFLTIITMIGGFFVINDITNNIPLIALVWDMLFLSFALAHRIKTLMKTNQENEHRLLIQSKFSLIGEITGNISHQWREPLGGLGAILAKSKANLLYANPSKEEQLQAIDLSNSIVQHLSETVDTFKDFYKLNPKEENIFEVNSTITKCINFIKELYQLEKIDIEFSAKNHYKIMGKSNEFSQVILSIIHNAKEALIENKIKNAKIMIKTFMANNTIIITISDNAGGIEKQYLKHLFDINFSQKKSGSGIGLYISQLIIKEKLNGSIQVKNTLEGACFTITCKQIL